MENNVVPLSLKTALETRRDLERQAKEGWEAFAAQLEAKIPPSLAKFANEKGWIRNPVDDFWALPTVLAQMAENTRSGGCNSEKIPEQFLESYGFTSFDDMQTKFVELKEAWAGLITIEIDLNEGYRAEVCYCATEFMVDT